MDPRQKKEEEHFRKIENAMLYADDSARRIGRIADDLAADGCDPFYVEVLRDCAAAIREEHRTLVKRAYFRPPDPAQGELLAGEASERLAS